MKLKGTSREESFLSVGWRENEGEGQVTYGTSTLQERGRPKGKSRRGKTAKNKTKGSTSGKERMIIIEGTNPDKANKMIKDGQEWVK